MCRIVTGNNSIWPNGGLMKFIKLVTSEDIVAAKELQGKDILLIYNIKASGEFSYAGPFLLGEQLNKAQSLINARSDQIKKYASRNKKLPNIWTFLAKRLF